VARISSFVPPQAGALNTGDMREYLTKARNVGTPHLIALDRRGHAWWTEGWDGAIGSLTLAQARPGTSNGVNQYAVPAPNCQPGANCGTHISGIAVDSSGTVWFDDSLSSRIGSYVPGSNAFTMFTVGGGTTSNAHPHDGLAIDGNNTLWFTEEFASKLGQAVQVAAVNKPPVNRRWYFANGRVGHGASESLTLANPAATTRCAVAVQYLYKPAGGRQTSKTLTVIVPPAARVSRSVNSDLNYPAYRARTASVSTVVRVNAAATPTCRGIAAHVFQQHYAGR